MNSFVSNSENGRARPTLPQPGEEVFHFRLLRELGHGAFARVFLAEQAELAGRPVVLKISSIDGDEPQTLAQLQHTHIVPIYSVHEDPQAGLRAVCMPYFGGACLATVLRTLWDSSPQPTKGRELVEALRAAQARATPPGGAQAEAVSDGPLSGRDAPAPSPGNSALDVLSGLDFVRASAWIVARLAEALQHAHERGVWHQDIKPSNILLAGDGQPLLLDFNLSRKTSSDEAHVTAILGGTVAYMAPEHLRALAAKGATPGRTVDQRADIYSLGMVLYYMLAGQIPFEQKGSYSVLPLLIELMALERSRGAPSVRDRRPQVPWGLESIIRKCLAPEPAERYQRAEDLADDLRRFLEDRPLRHAPELSRVEVARKWVRRHPRLASSTSVATAAGLLLFLCGASLLGAYNHLEAAQAELAAVQSEERKREFEDGTQRARCLANTRVDTQDLLAEGLQVCEKTLALYGVLDRDDWQSNPDWQRLSAAERREMAEDVRELLALLAWGRTKQDPRPEVFRGALDLLDRAVAIPGLAPSRALWEDRASYLGRVGDSAGSRAARAAAAEITPDGARDYYLLATSYARAGDYARAVAELDKALSLNPRHYWASFQRGLCHQELGQFMLAASDFGTCVGLWPDFAPGYFNRGYALDRGGYKDQAVRDYGTALVHDPAFVPAYLNRGMARLEAKRFDEALADFQHATKLGRDDAFLHAGFGVALEGLARHLEADTAFQAAFERLGAAPPEVRTRIHWVYGFAVSRRLPERALDAFGSVLRESPGHPQALYGRAMILVEQGERESLLPLLSAAIDAEPGFLDARRFRAILLARCGRPSAATDEINVCLEREPTSGSFLYAAACVASLAAQQEANPTLRRLAVQQAVAFLERAFARGYGQERAAADSDLAGIRAHPDFKQLLASGGGQ